MNQGIRHIIFFIAICLAFSANAQLSPGDLSKPHAKYEGITNCTLCHEFGKKITDAKCLDCHKEIKNLIDRKKGYHSSKEVSKKNCIACHSDHNGRNFKMVKIDELNFNHLTAGYALEGKHESIDCRKCHMPDNIRDAELKKRKNTFLGLDEKCLSCHDEYHQEKLSTNDCLSCHDMEAFSPATRFDHNNAAYVLKGAHKTTDCKKCHATTIKNGKEFQQFTGLQFDDCVSCHKDAHQKQIKGQCKQCHTEKGFDSFIGKGRFNHKQTGFTLKGQHKKIDCFTCHIQSTDPLKVFQDKNTVKETNCIACHEDQHSGKYGNACAKCHSETGFLALKKMDFFDHGIADYSLEGKHTEVDCKACHTKNYSSPIDFSACKNCHSDYHRGEFVKKDANPDCNECHSLQQGFEYSLYDIDRHNKTDFILKGAHLATPCFSCHKTDKQWKFKNLGKSCNACHSDIHQKQISPEYYPDQDCTACHEERSWETIHFDHNLTQWPLEGQHNKAKCAACHFEDPLSGKVVKQRFKDLNTDCSTCHKNVHEDQFAINGTTDCKRCHNPKDWFPYKFDHNKTAFPLEGRHAEIACKACHPVTVTEGKKHITYKIGKFECIDCHK